MPEPIWTDEESEAGEEPYSPGPDLAPQEVARRVLALGKGADGREFRGWVLLAEDTCFPQELCTALAPCLLELAVAWRDSSDPQDAPAVWAAIRTGGSMLGADEAHRLVPLLEPAHAIETSMVAVKMLGRVFEAHPPQDVDQHENLAREVRTIVNSLLNRYAVASSESAAMAQLAVYAVVTMASSGSADIMRDVRELGLSWFTRRMSRRLSALLEQWRRPGSSAGGGVLDLLERALRQLGPCPSPGGSDASHPAFRTSSAHPSL